MLDCLAIFDLQFCRQRSIARELRELFTSSISKGIPKSAFETLPHALRTARVALNPPHNRKLNHDYAVTSAMPLVSALKSRSDIPKSPAEMAKVQRSCPFCVDLCLQLLASSLPASASELIRSSEVQAGFVNITVHDHVLRPSSSHSKPQS